METAPPELSRLALVCGNGTLQQLRGIRVIVFGLGGVGSWCAEALVRSGVGCLTIVDSDSVCITNINRQVQATQKTVGLFKAQVLRERLLEINPLCNVTAVTKVFCVGNSSVFNIESFDYVIDAIDSLTNKIDLIMLCTKTGVPVFSCMGMAQKLDPTQIKTAGIWQTHGCPLARLVRTGLRKRNFNGSFTAVYSSERLPLHPAVSLPCGKAVCLCPSRNADDPDAPKEWCGGKKIINGSAVTVTASAGMVLASLVLQDVMRKANSYGG
ncbi:tRNA threonylcarbamoyladenosine dehydratase [Spirochaetia bacterium]|nr:tRNA threonylcarbamoyladenosine dehydratase [Spirochaetia bacterium]